MSNTWAKVRNFLDMMNFRDLHLPLPLSSTSSSCSSRATSDLHPLSIGAEVWQVGEKTTQQILSLIQPTADSESRRREIIEYLQTLIDNAFGLKVFPFGSVPLKTYLPHGDVDLTAVSHYDISQDLAAEICNLLQNEERNNSRIQVRDVLYVPAQVKVVKCTVSNIAVDISFNQTAGLHALCFLEQVDQLIGKDHLFKRSVILIKAWCYYESRLLGGFHGLISTYALETMVLHVINHFHLSLHCPLAVLYKFLEYYSTFDWGSHCIAVNGLVAISSLPVILVKLPQDCDELLLTDDFLRNCREAFLPSTGVLRTKSSSFAVKFLNILDPLRDDNNLGRSVSKGNFYRIKSALTYGTQKLGEVLMLPPEKIRKGLEKFFVNTLEINGRGRRIDVQVPVPVYGARSSETSAAKRERDNLLAGNQYGLYFHDYSVMYPIPPNNTSATPPQVWNDGWLDMSPNLQYDQSMYYNIDDSPPSSVDSATGFPLANAPVDRKGTSKGTGPYIPHIEHLRQRDLSLEEDITEEESGKEVEANAVPEATEYSCPPIFSLEDFPTLPGSKPIPIKVTGTESSNKGEQQVNETLLASEDSHSLEFGSIKCSTSPRSVSLSEPGKHSDSDVSVVLDLPNDLIVSVEALAVEEDQESSKSEEKPMVEVVPVQPFPLTDDQEFPPLSRPAKPEIMFTKKEFPTLGAALRSGKKSGKWKNNFKEAQKRE